MSDIEDTVISIRELLKDSKQTAVSGDGNTKAKDFATDLVQKSVSLNDLTSFDDFVNYYLYGNRFKENLGYWKGKKKIKNEKGGEVEVETRRSYARLLTNIQNWYSKVALSFAPVSGVAAMTGAVANSFFVASKGRYFTASQLSGSMLELSKGPWGKGLSIARAFDLAEADNSFKKANELSAIKANSISVNDTLMFMLRAADNGTANAVLLSVLKNHAIDKDGSIKILKTLPEGTKSIYDQLEDKDGKVTNLKDVLTDAQFGILRNRTYRLMETIVGMSGRNNMNSARLSILGNMFMQFKNWMPMMIHERLAGVDYDSELDSITKGKYLVFFNTLWDKKALPMLLESFKTVVGMKNSEAFDEKIRELYESEFEKNGTLDRKIFTFENYKQMYIENLRSTIIEAAFMTSLVGLIALAQGGDDPSKKNKFMIKALDRALSEFTFFINPKTFIDLAGSSVPVAGFLLNNYLLGKHLGKEVFGTITGDEKLKKEAIPMRYVYKDFPVAKEIDRWFEISQQ